MGSLMGMAVVAQGGGNDFLFLFWGLLFENITSKRTSSGISIDNWNDVIGKEAEQDFSKDSIIKIPNGGFYED